MIPVETIMSRFASLIAILSLSATAWDVSVPVSYKNAAGQNFEGNGFVIVVPGLEELHFVMTVAHILGSDEPSLDSVNINVDGKGVETTIVAICKEYDLCLLCADVPKHAKLELPEPGKHLDEMPLTLYVTKEPKTIPVRINGTDGWQWKIKGHYEMGFSGGAVCILQGNFLAGMANAAFVKSRRADAVISINPNSGLIVPVPIIRKFLAVAAEHILSNDNKGDIVCVTKKTVDEFKPSKIVIECPKAKTYELKGKQ
jgi:hypothetical protein